MSSRIKSENAPVRDFQTASNRFKTIDDSRIDEHMCEMSAKYEESRCLQLASADANSASTNRRRLGFAAANLKHSNRKDSLTFIFI
jgi:hypothetical protein